MKYGIKKVIVSGGFVESAKDGGLGFCHAISNNFPKSKRIRILECLFARPEERWGVGARKDIAFFKKYISDKKFSVSVARVESFAAQIKNSDVVYFRGGILKN
ncbi:hypothetical protein JW899_04770 [Candidatus Uhrbacteria bacterium]|nr:hypothetical protein [Candidatus Uhrbacteria bacterium]